MNFLGLCPRARDEDTGKLSPKEKDPITRKERAKVDVREELGVARNYGDFQHPDLLVAHIGSSAEQEFGAWEDKQKWLTRDNKEPDEQWYYYENHLGLLGLLAMLDHMQPKAAIISEFGAEMRGFHFELVKRLAEICQKKQQRDNPEGRSFIVPGDLTMV